MRRGAKGNRHTKFLPEEGKDLAGVKLCRKTSDRGQRLATISLCSLTLAIVEGQRNCACRQLTVDIASRGEQCELGWIDKARIRSNIR